jgi:hypothetical protein
MTTTGLPALTSLPRWHVACDDQANTGRWLKQAPATRDFAAGRWGLALGSLPNGANERLSRQSKGTWRF